MDAGGILGTSGGNALIDDTANADVVTPLVDTSVVLDLTEAHDYIFNEIGGSWQVVP